VPVDVAWVTAVGTNTVAPNAGGAGGAKSGVVAWAAGGATAATCMSSSSAPKNGNKDSEAKEQPETNNADPRTAIRDFWKSMARITFGSEKVYQSTGLPRPRRKKLETPVAARLFTQIFADYSND
jgi:hypothetical protein